MRRIVRCGAATLAGAAVLAAVVIGELMWFRRRGARPVPGPHALDGLVSGGSRTAIARWVWLGDSLSAGVGAADASEAFPRQAAELVAHQARCDIHLVCLARPGATSADVLIEQVPIASELLAPGMTVIVFAGCNDALRFIPRKVFEANYRDSLTALRGTGATVVCVGLPDLGWMMAVMAQPLRALMGVEAARLDRVIRSVTEESGVDYVALAEGTYASERRGRPTLRLLSHDRWHPNEDGYQAWAAILAARLSACGTRALRTGSESPPAGQPRDGR
jgi:lysophospholipase L1-like esterase